MSFKSLSICFVVISSLLLIGCGGSDGGTASNVEISFPENNLVTEADSVTVNGYFSGSPAISVNGEAVRVRGNTWFAQVALAQGDNPIAVEVNGSLLSEINVTRKVLLNNVRSLTVSGANSTLHVSNGDRYNYQIPIATGTAEILSSVSSYRPTVSLRDESQNRYLGIDWSGNLRAWDMTSDVMTTISNTSAAGLRLSSLQSIAVVPGSAYISMSSGIYSLNPVTGERVLMSAPEANIMNTAIDMEVDTAGSRILVLENSTAKNLLAVSTNTATLGVKTVLMDSATATPILGFSWQPTKLSFDSLNNFVYLLQSNAIIKVDLNTTPVTVTNLFTLPITPGSLVVSPDGTKLYYTIADTMYMIDLTVLPLATQVYSSPSVGTGSWWTSSRALEVSADGASVYVVGTSYIYKVDQTGNRLASYIGTTMDLDMDGSSLYTIRNSQVLSYLESATTAVGTSFLVSDNNYRGLMSLQNTNNVSLVSNEAFVASPNVRAVIGVDLTTGERRYLTDNYTNDILANYTPSGFGVANGFGYVYDSTVNALYKVELTTGVRSTISQFSLGIGTGVEIGTMSVGLALDPASNLAYVADNTNRAVISVDLTTGNRTVVSNATVGAGVDYGYITQIAFDPNSVRIFALDSENDGILSIDPANGNRDIFYSFKIGNGPSLEVSSMDFNNADKHIYYLDYNDAILKLNPNTGDREIVHNNEMGSGPLAYPIDFVMFSNRVFVLENDRIKVIDLATGVRSNFSVGDNVEEVAVGAGDNFTTDLSFIALDSDNGRIFVGNEDWFNDAAIWSVDTKTGDRTIIASSTVGTGANLSYPLKAIYSSFEDILYVANDGEEFIKINLETGDRSVFLINNEYWMYYNKMVIDDVNAYIYVTDSSVYRIDLFDGSVTWLPFGEEDYYGVTIDKSTGKLYAYEENTPTIRLLDTLSNQTAIVAK